MTLTLELRTWKQCGTHRLKMGMNWESYLQIPLLVTKLCFLCLHQTKICVINLVNFVSAVLTFAESGRLHEW